MITTYGAAIILLVIARGVWYRSFSGQGKVNRNGVPDRTGDARCMRPGHYCDRVLTSPPALMGDRRTFTPSTRRARRLAHQVPSPVVALSIDNEVRSMTIVRAKRPSRRIVPLTDKPTPEKAPTRIVHGPKKRHFENRTDGREIPQGIEDFFARMIRPRDAD
jgi:hypothetical protein